jgi:catechol 2,3-dioxygenase-like lactoylglutathione lyase family enzyme
VIDHVDIRVSDRAASERFYTTVLGAIGREPIHSDDVILEWGDFDLLCDGRPVARRLHIAFFVPTTDLVHAFHAAGLAAGYEDAGRPGPRPQYTPEYYGAFLLDPDGNSVEAVRVKREGQKDGGIDHLWLRTRDLQAIKRFYATVGAFADVQLADEAPDRVSFLSGPSAFSYVLGDEPTENVHIAFAASTNEQVDAFHQAATAAGYTDNGAPGERAAYHEGYYGAFVLDPDGHNIEVVNHNRP